MNSRTIVFIHGMFVTPRCWSDWTAFFSGHGFTCHAPAYPRGREVSPEKQRLAHPSPELAELRLTEVIEHYARFVSQLPEKPILIGHSMGGLIAQLLVQRGLASAAVLISSGPPTGILSLEFSFLKSLFPMFNPFVSGNTPYLMPFSHWQYTFTHSIPLAQQQASYEAQLVPESRHLPRDAIGATGKIDLTKAHVPLLFMAGSDDQIMPTEINKKNLAAYKDPTSTRAYKEFSGRTHFIIGQDKWQEVAEYARSWIAQQ